MATIRSSASKATVSIFDTVGITADTFAKSIGSIGRAADAGYSWADAWAKEVEAGSKFKVKYAEKIGKQKAVLKLIQHETEIEEELKTEQQRSRFNELMAED